MSWSEIRAAALRYRRAILLVGVCLLAANMLHLVVSTLLQRSAASLEQQVGELVDLRAGTVAQVLHNYEQGLENYFELMIDLACLRAEGNPLATGIGISRRLEQQAQSGRFAVLGLGIIDADGRAQWSSVNPDARADLRDRDHYTALLHPGSRTYVSKPLVGRVTGRLSVQVSRRIEDASGNFLGVAVISWDPLLLAQALDQLEGPESQLIGLWREDGVLLARSGLPPGVSPPVDLISTHLPNADGRQVFRVISQLAHEDRFVALRRLHDLPVFISISLPAEPFMAGYVRYRRLAHLAEGAFVLLLISGVVLAELLRARRHAATAVAAERAEVAAGASRLAELTRVLDGVQAVVAIQRARAGHFFPPSMLNAGTAKLLRLAPESLDPHERFMARAEPPTTEADRQAIFAALLRDGHFEHELRLRCGDGVLRWMRMSSTVIAREGEEIETVQLLIDIEAEKAAAAAAVAAARLATLGEISTGIAHEVNQPLAIILLSAENAIRQLRKGEAAVPVAIRKLELIQEMASRAADVGQHLMTFARRKPVELQNVGLQAVLDGALLLVGHALREADVQLEVSLPADLPEVPGQRNMLEQVLINLILNARDAILATPGAQRRLQIAGRSVAGRVVLEVIDSGPGIPAALLPRLFEPFFTTKGDGKGTGLGLSICYDIIRACGGELVADNASDEPELGGARFTITFARQLGAADDKLSWLSGYQDLAPQPSVPVR